MQQTGCNILFLVEHHGEISTKALIQVYRLIWDELIPFYRWEFNNSREYLASVDTIQAKETEKGEVCVDIKTTHRYNKIGLEGYRSR